MSVNILCSQSNGQEKRVREIDELFNGAGIELIDFRSDDDNEYYTVKIQGKILSLDILSNRVDGGWLVVKDITKEGTV